MYFFDPETKENNNVGKMYLMPSFFDRGCAVDDNILPFFHGEIIVPWTSLLGEGEWWVGGCPGLVSIEPICSPILQGLGILPTLRRNREFLGDNTEHHRTWCVFSSAMVITLCTGTYTEFNDTASQAGFAVLSVFCHHW
jgi:hypothetical protein